MRREYGIVLLDALCAGILSAGAGLVLLPALGLGVSALPLALAVALPLAVLAVSGRRVWIPLAALAGIGAAAFLLATMFGRTGELAAAIGEYARWAWEETQNGRPRLLVCLACLIPVDLVFWALLRLGSRWRLSCLWAVTLLCAGLMGFRAVFLPEGWLAPFLLLWGGLILYLPRATLGREGRLQAQLLALLLAVPVLGLTLALGPKDNGEWRSRAVGYLVQDVQDFWQFHWGDLPSPPITTMRSMGLQPQRDRLGGDIYPDDSPVITSSQGLLLRGQTLEVYTGDRWEDGGEEWGNFRYDSLLWGLRKSRAFGLDLPRSVSKPLLKELLTDVDADLRALRSFRSVFLPYRPEGLAFSREYGDLYFNLQGEAYWNRPPDASAEYHVEGRTWNYRSRDFDKNMLLLEKAMLDEEEVDGEWEPIAGRCLQLPETLPPWVGDLARELTAECRSPYDKAMALRDWLSESCTYTLTPGDGDAAQDFVADFLTARQGYCTYYASALTVLCRCAGVPARYVTGYGMTKEGGRWEASQATAHAWTEVYLSCIGWVPLDALGQEIFEQEVPVPEESLLGGAPMGPTSTPSPAPPEAGEIFLEPEPEGRFNPLALLWAAPAALAAAGFLLAKRLRSRRYRLDYVRRKFSQTGPAAGHCYTGLLRLLRILGLAPREGETLLAFWERAAEALPSGQDWREIGRVMDRLRFGESPPDWEEIAGMCGAYAALEKYIRETQSLPKRLRV